MTDHKHPNPLDDREEWEGDRALYEIELQRAFEEASNRRALWLTSALICQIITVVLIPGWLALLGVALATASAGILLRLHMLENREALVDLSQKLELKFPEKLTPRLPLREED
jgi:hypothetical protein